MSVLRNDSIRKEFKHFIQRVCKKNGMNYHTLNVEMEFRDYSSGEKEHLTFTSGEGSE